jgi:hypothetical protein
VQAGFALAVVAAAACGATSDDAEPSTSPSSRVVVGAPELDSSTYNKGSFRVTNDSDRARIARVQFDLSSALLPDLTFDPEGVAGDSLGKAFTVDADPGVGRVDHRYAHPHDGGYDVLTATFTRFDPGKTLTFSADIDPTTIRGAKPPGPGESGSVSGLELAGATVTVSYDDGSSDSGRLFPGAGQQGQSELRLGEDRSAAATLESADDAASLRVTAPPGASVRVVTAGTTLFTDGLPGGGFDIDPDEANTVVTVTEHTVTIGPDGAVTLPLDTPANPVRAIAAVLDGDVTGPPSEVLLVRRSSASG